MTNEQKKQAILEKIREVCDLKRLEFGCEVLDRKDNLIKKIAGSNGENNVLIKGIGEIEKYKLLDICDYKIIGLPVELNHLLMTLKKSKNLLVIKFDLSASTISTTHSEINYWDFERYDLSLSVEQNLDNEALTDLIYELII